MFRAIALCGGGVRGGLLVGALKAIEEVQGSLQFPKGIYGTSIGAVVGTAVAFNLKISDIEDMYKSMGSLQDMLNPLSLSTINKITKKKGISSMDKFEEKIVNLFALKNIDLRGKLISDAPQKLNIVASNMTTLRPTIFTGKVPILDALRCSCCIPFAFEPQILYNNVYMDGGILTYCIDRLIPQDVREECMIVHITRPPSPITPRKLEEMTVTSFMYAMYACVAMESISSDICWIRTSDVIFTDVQTADSKAQMLKDGYEESRRFLTQRLLNKSDNLLLYHAGI